MELSEFSGLNGSYVVFPGTIYMINMNYRSRELVGENLCTFSNTSVKLALSSLFLAFFRVS